MEQDYSQKWQAYDAAQCKEKTIFIPLLAELCKNAEPKDYKFDDNFDVAPIVPNKSGYSKDS